MIQLIDNSTVHRRIVRYVLQEHGHTVLVAANSAEAIEQLAHNALDLSIVHISFSAMRSVGWLKQLQAPQPDRHLPILITTDSGRELDYSHAFEAGARAVLAWPFSAAELITVVRHLTEGGLHNSISTQQPLPTVRFASSEHTFSLESYQRAS
jgi:twitching motility two-component system response regulator PilH